MQTVTTADGAILEYLVTGPPDGDTLLFQGGTPNAAAHFSGVVDPATALGLRTVSYSRPGYGASTPRPGRAVADAISDIETVLEAVGATDFVTLGWSGGGPHALAAGALLPERCRAVAVLAGVAPYRAHGIDFLDGMGEDNVREFAAAAAGFEELSALLEPMGAELAAVTGPQIIDSLAGLLPSVDQAALTGRFGEEMADAMRRGMSTGIAGWRDDDLAFVKGWGFDVADISVPVDIWQGRQDRMVPFAHGQWLAAQVPTAEPHLFADEGHLSLVGQLDTVLAELLRRAESR